MNVCITYRSWFSVCVMLMTCWLVYACRSGWGTALQDMNSRYQDQAFEQEYHEAYPLVVNGQSVAVRRITVDSQSTIWIASAAGVFMKSAAQPNWVSLPFPTEQGPAYAVAVDQQSTVWLGMWNGLFRYRDQQLERLDGPVGPISELCAAPEGVYALGPAGVWLINKQGCQKKSYSLPRSIRRVISDRQGRLWVATDVGLYHIDDTQTRIFQRPDELLSASVRGIALDQQRNVWVGGLGGVTVLGQDKPMQTLEPKQGIPSSYVNCVSQAPDGRMWVGTDVGVVRYSPDGSHSLRFTRRWLLDDRVEDVAFDAQGTAWVATAGGVSAIRRRSMTLAQKQDYFYDVLMKRHIRLPWIAGQCRLKQPGDISTWEPDDDDNDGEYTGNYLAMEAFRYAATHDPDAKANAKKAFNFLKLLQEVTGTDGFFARTIVPANWTHVDDTNRTYTPQEQADELVKEPRFKPVEVRWRKSKDGKWLWKGDTSSDEVCGHMMGYYFYYELVADEAEKAVVRAHVARLVDHLIAHNFTLTDIDGKPTRWGVWSPDMLNRNPDWAPDRAQNSMELLAFLKLAYYMTGKPVYEQHYRNLIDKEGYLDNMARIKDQNPAWFIYFDVMLAAYVYPILVRCEQDPKLRAFYEAHMDQWLQQRKGDKNPLINFLYCYSRNKSVELASSVEFLVDTPLDLVNWTVDHTKREDVRIIRTPVLDEWQVSELPPASIRTVVRWDKNPWAAVNGTPDIEREPVFWLLPYWMGRYLKMIQ
ncbi:ligand-binding sensor domain-containing protein [Spirosoma aerolatum]|uniref:ligand-binding sensor domain-containing protein n=1 Tax=Spirosoma aerolatum TaxID=1211326 RepID=UPI0009ABFC02|nr:two-component regulator propeller domain-containing protein [Spirosoma aerolatum]